MTDQEPDHDAIRSADPSQNDGEFSSATAVQEREDTTEQHRVGIVAHRDQFNEPDESAEPPSDPEREDFSAKLKSLMKTMRERSNRNPASPLMAASKPKLRTIFLAAGYSIKTSPYGGIALHGTTIFGKSVEIMMREIKSIEPVAEILDSSLEQVSLKEAAERLFVTCEGSPFDLRDPENWFRYLEQVAFPVIESMTEHWIGASSAKTSNPVTEFFFGPNGLLHFHQDRKSVIRRLQSMRSNPTIVLMTRYQGPALVLVYEK